MIFVRDLGAPETPRLLPSDKSWLCVEMAPDRGSVTRISRDGSSVEIVAHVGTPNGLCIDADDAIWVANTLPVPSLMRVTLAGTTEVFMEEVEDKPMLLPNDLAFGPDGLLYMTDSGMCMTDWVVDGFVRPDFESAEYDGRVYQIDLASRSGRILDTGIRFTNGIAFGPDDHLYVNEMLSGDIFRYTFDKGSPTGEREHFANVLTADWAGGFRGPDGMGFGEDGRLYCAVYGQADVTVIAPDGSVEKRITTAGSNPTNVAWGPDGDTRLFVTEHELGQIELFDTDTVALPLRYGGPSRVRL